jgi:hypothetical protein
MWRRIVYLIFAGVALATSFLSTATQARTLVISCERDSKYTKIFIVDLDNKTVHHDTGPKGPVSYTVRADISEKEISWQWTVVDYKLDRYTGVLIDGGPHVDTVTWHCQTANEKSNRDY